MIKICETIFHILVAVALSAFIAVSLVIIADASSKLLTCKGGMQWTLLTN